MKDNSSFLIIGCGDIGRRVAKRLIQQGFEVSATSHSSNSEKLESIGINTFSADLDSPESLQNINRSFDYVFYFAPPNSLGITDSRITGFLNSYLKTHLCKRLLYISTTGVYGDQNEKWIDENTPTNPTVDRSLRRLNAEEQVKSFSQKFGVDFIIVRVAGIYSLEKLPINRLQHGKQILDRKLSGSSNRIHADDLAQICVTAILNSNTGEIYNATDGHPSTMSDYFIEVANTFDLPKPEEVDWKFAEENFTPAMLSYLKESKKISAEKIQQQLGITLKYPSLKEGLEQCLEQYNAENKTS